MGTVLVVLYRHRECFPVLGVLLGDENVDVRDRGSRLELAKLRQEYEQEITVRRVRICGPIKKCVRVLRSRRRIHRTVVPGMGEYEGTPRDAVDFGDAETPTATKRRSRANSTDGEYGEENRCNHTAF